MSGGKQVLRDLVKQRHPTGDSRVLCENILAHPWFLEARTVMGFSTIFPEPDILAVLQASLRMGKTLALPRCGVEGSMTARRVTSLSELKPGAFGILEPTEMLPVIEPEQLDLILTPGMAFSPQGGRLGRGKGYYDRFFPKTRGRVIGVCFESAVFGQIPMEFHDRFMDAVITDSRVILCEMEG